VGGPKGNHETPKDHFGFEARERERSTARAISVQVPESAFVLQEVPGSYHQQDAAHGFFKAKCHRRLSNLDFVLDLSCAHFRFAFAGSRSRSLIRF